MTLKECYQKMNANYDDVIARLGKEQLVTRILKMMLSDNNMELLVQSIGEGNYENAFRAAHTLKGIALNLGLTSLSQSSSDLTEELRDLKYTPRINELFEITKNDYEAVIQVVKEFEAGE